LYGVDLPAIDSTTAFAAAKATRLAAPSQNVSKV
jgi:hypothetical protein